VSNKIPKYGFNSLMATCLKNALRFAEKKCTREDSNL
jgi:hypothetical protein